jgi:AP-4 complex subunit epsilon-1
MLSEYDEGVINRNDHVDTVDAWYPLISDLTFRTWIFPFSVEEAQAFLRYIEARKWDQPLSEDVANCFSGFRQRISDGFDRMKAEAPPGSGFFGRLGTHSPKDAVAAGRRSMQRMRGFVNAEYRRLYAQLSDEYDLDFVALLLCDLADAYEGPRDWVLNALLQVVGKLDDVPPQVSEVFENYKQSRSIIVQEICFEALALLAHRATLAAAVEPLVEEFDDQLSFLDQLVADAVKRGQRAYIDIAMREGDLSGPKQPTVKVSHTPGGPTVVYSASGVASQASEPVDEGRLVLTGVTAVWGEAGLQTESASAPGGLPAPVDAPKAAEARGSAFSKFQIKPVSSSGADAHRDKFAKSLFSKTPAARKATAAPRPPPTASAATLQVAAASPYGPSRGGLTEDDYKLLDDVAAEIAAPLPDAIREFSQLGEPVPAYDAGPLKVAALARRGGILLLLNNSGDAPILGLKAAIAGPDVLLKEVVSHPRVLAAIPAQQTVLLLASFKFPQQAKGFPEFRFAVTLEYSGIAPVTFALPDANLATFIVPLEATTQQFSGFWRQGGNEQVYTLPKTPDITLDALAQVLHELLHVKTVQRIQSEEIFIGNLYSTPLKILIHIKCGAQNIDLKVLTKAAPLTTALIELLKSVLG